MFGSGIVVIQVLDIILQVFGTVIMLMNDCLCIENDAVSFIIDAECNMGSSEIVWCSAKKYKYKVVFGFIHLACISPHHALP